MLLFLPWTPLSPSNDFLCRNHFLIDDKKLGGVLKKLNLQDLKGVEEVNIFMTNDDVIHITQPKIQASIPCNTYVVSGNSEKKKLAELLPDIVTQLGPEQMATLRRYAESTIGAGAAAAGAAGEEEEEEDDDVPELVENFEEAANK